MINETYKKTEIAKEISEYAFVLFLSICFSFVINKYVLARADVEGTSMLSTLKDKDITFVEKFSVITKSYKRGEIVIFNSNNSNKDIYIKRIIGLAGDTIEIRNDKIYLNGNPLSEPYLTSGTITSPETFLNNQMYTIPKGYVFVLGDNREDSLDSRFFGPVKISDIQGHAFVRIYPFSSFGFL